MAFVIITKMVAKRTLKHGLPIPPSPLRLKTDKKTKDYVKSWLADFPEEISRQAASLTTKFVALGFNNHSDIILLDDSFLPELLDMG